MCNLDFLAELVPGQAVAFIHAHGTAHGDLGNSDFLSNYGGSTFSPMYCEALESGGPFRSLFPCRYYLIDLELATHFHPEVPVKDRKLSPHNRMMETHGISGLEHYGKVRRQGLC